METKSIFAGCQLPISRLLLALLVISAAVPLGVFEQAAASQAGFNRPADYKPASAVVVLRRPDAAIKVSAPLQVREKTPHDSCDAAIAEGWLQGTLNGQALSAASADCFALTLAVPMLQMELSVSPPAVASQQIVVLRPARYSLAAPAAPISATARQAAIFQAAEAVPFILSFPGGTDLTKGEVGGIFSPRQVKSLFSLGMMRC